MQKYITKLNGYGDDLILDQVDSLEQIQEQSKIFFVNLERLHKIHSSEEWRQDAYLIRSEIGPILRLHVGDGHLPGMGIRSSDGSR